MPGVHPKATPKDDVLAFFAQQKKTVLTFLGYSGAGYEQPNAMLEQAEKVLTRFDPRTTIVNIGATADGIGAVYALAKARGFATTGIVSTEALAVNAEISPAVDHVFFVEDASWGGFLDDGETLSPTSEIKVAVSDDMVAIGGNRIVRDELLGASQRGREIDFIPTDMDHQRARRMAEEKGQAEPTSFGGLAGKIFNTQSDQ